MQLIDSHCHFDADAFDPDRAAVHARATQAGIGVQIVPAIAASGWSKLKRICAEFPGLYPAYGLHPMYLDVHQPEHVHHLHEWIERERPLAIGECGLDYFVEGLDPQAQQFYFEGQLKLARTYGLPVIVHARRAVDATIATIRRINGNTGKLRGVVHSFSGSAEQAAQLHKLGFLIGIGGPVTHVRANRLRNIVATMPLEQLLLETDSPDQPGAAHRGQRNEPAFLSEVLDVVAELRGISHEQLADATCRNAARLFNLPVSA